MKTSQTAIPIPGTLHKPDPPALTPGFPGAHLREIPLKTDPSKTI